MAMKPVVPIVTAGGTGTYDSPMSVDSKNIIYEWQWIYSYIISSKYFLTVVMT
jgi:hypothetical protein